MNPQITQIETKKLEALLKAAKEMREACAAAARVIAQRDDALDDFNWELRALGIRNGFGRRLQNAIAAVEEEIACQG